MAGAGLGVQIATAARAKPFAVGAAERTSGEGQEDLFPQNVFQHQTFFLIITDFSVGRAEGAVGGAGVGALGAEDEIEVAAEGVADGIETAGAGDLEGSGPGGAGADVGDDFFGAAMLMEDFGQALNVEGRELGGFDAVVDGAGSEVEVEADGLAFEIEEGDEHGGNLAQGGVTFRLRTGKVQVNVWGMDGEKGVGDNEGQTMNFLTHTADLLGLLSVHVNVNWPRFLVSIIVLGGLVWYTVYAWVRR